MRFGITLPTAHEGHYLPSPFAGPKEMVKLVQTAESLGFYSAWGLDLTTTTPERKIVSKTNPNWYEILLTVSYLFAATDKIRLGPMSYTLPYRDPILVAKQLATVDAFSEGRLLMGLGVGFRQEYEAIKPREKGSHRGHRLDEALEAVSSLLTQESASFQGKYYEFKDIALEPKPLQNPLPIYIAGKTPTTYKRLAKYASGWVLSRAQTNPVRERIEDLKPYFDEAGRDISKLDIVSTKGLSIAQTHEQAVKQFQESMLPQRMDLLASQEGIGGAPSRDRVMDQNLIGTPSDIGEQVQRLKESGVTHCAAFYPTAPTFEQMLEEVHMFGEEVLPLFKD